MIGDKASRLRSRITPYIRGGAKVATRPTSSILTSGGCRAEGRHRSCVRSRGLQSADVHRVKYGTPPDASAGVEWRPSPPQTVADHVIAGGVSAGTRRGRRATQFERAHLRPATPPAMHRGSATRPRSGGAVRQCAARDVSTKDRERHRCESAPDRPGQAAGGVIDETTGRTRAVGLCRSSMQACPSRGRHARNAIAPGESARGADPTASFGPGWLTGAAPLRFEGRW